MTSEYCGSPAPVGPTLLRHLTFPCAGVWEPAEGGGRDEGVGREPVVHGKSMKTPRPSFWSLRMCSLRALCLQLIGPSILQLWDYVNNPKKEIDSMKIPKSLGLKGLMSSQHQGCHNFSFQLIFFAIPWFVYKMYSKRNK